ncbi:MAG: metal-dependent hydrolase, partial [Pseudomonadota bacterium]
MSFLRRAPVPESLTVEVDGRPVTARLRLNPRAKRITLRVDQTRREAVVTAPARRHVARATRLLAEHGLWLSRLLD